MSHLFHIFCALLIACSTFVVQCNNPIYAVLFLILAFFNASALVLLSGHDYLAALLIVLYVGALCTFFLFAIMILNIRMAEVSEKRLKLAPISAMIGLLFAFELETVVSGFETTLSNDQSQLALSSLGCSNPLSQNLLNATTQIYALGTVLYTHYAYDLILASLILLAAMLGSIALTLSKSSSGLRQQIYEQNLRDFKQTIVKHR